ncbi:14351_t:CDS:2 [Funneliformis caledonium]|uniref:14351_t:CDS:1 n=1 Tax=Funneliformis caledonium TaxID=1117310 RepID=A0A9N8V885_9GLOM|nr:14351_t:CDS:2 [Funneliformis caledonium]
MDAVTGKNKEFQKQNRHTDVNLSDLITYINKNEPLFDGSNYLKTGNFHSKKIEECISKNDFQYVSFKEFLNNSSFSVLDQSQIEIKRQVNILKELKDSDHIIRFFNCRSIIMEIAELKKSHSDLNKSEILISIRKRVHDKYLIDQEPQWRSTIFFICHNHSISKPTRILSVEKAIQEHKSNNGNKQLVWQSFKHHLETNIDAKYWRNS